MKPKKQKSGFEQGRSKTRPSLSNPSNKKDKQTAYEKKVRKLNKAKEELSDVLREVGSTRREKELLSDSKRSKRDRDDERGAGMPGSDGIEGQISVFENEMEVVRGLISNESVEYNAELANKMLLRSMLAMTLDIIPIAEKAFRQTTKENAAYAVNALINQAREIATDLKMMGDVENQAKFIRESIIIPMFTAQAQNMLHEMLSLKSVIDTELDKSPKTAKIVKRRVDDTLRTIANFMTQSSDKMTSDIESYLSGDMASIGTKPKKAKKK